jgi:hypothetical protein
MAVSAYERVASWLLSAVALLGATVVGLATVWLGNRVLPAPTLAVEVTPISIEEDIDGGYEHGKLGESIEIPGEITGELGTGKPPALMAMLEETVATVRSTVTSETVALDDALLREEEPWSTGGVGGTRGTGNAPPLGLGGGTRGGVRRGERWLIEYDEGGSLDDYARQLDFFQVELGALAGSDVSYAAQLAQPTPASRTGKTGDEDRLFFSWRKGSLQEADRQLLAKAGVDTNGKIIVQFFPQNTEDLLATIERQYMQQRAPGRDIRTVRRTRFGVRTAGPGYEFHVKEQTYLGR